MHEMSIADTIFKVVRAEAKKQNITGVSEISLKIGRMNAFRRENLETYLKANADDPMFRGVHFKIVEIDVGLKCSSCGMNFKDERFDDFDFAHTASHAKEFYTPPPCPHCDAKNSDIISGEELELVGIVSS